MSVKVLGVFKNAKETREVPAGTVIFEEGSAGEEMFGIVAGRVELRMANGHAYSLGPDETFSALVTRLIITNRAERATRATRDRVRPTLSALPESNGDSLGKPRGGSVFKP